jgi:hypothetical protein
MKPVCRLHHWLNCTVLVMLGATHVLASAERLPMPKGNENFGAEALSRGVFATELECSTVSGAVWARTDVGEAECLRYWASGIADGPTNPRALIYIPGDQLAFDQPAPGYTSLNPGKMQSLVDEMALKVDVPLILVARPGTFGSSGEHKQRRRRLEPQLVSHALDELKTRHGIQELTLVGLSGGGHIVASLTALGGHGKDDGSDWIRRLLRAVAALETRGDEPQAASVCAGRSKGQQCEMVDSAANRRSAEGVGCRCRGCHRGRQRYTAARPGCIRSADRISVPPGPADLGDSEGRGTRPEGLTELAPHRTAGMQLHSEDGCSMKPVLGAALAHPFIHLR